MAIFAMPAIRSHDYDAFRKLIPTLPPTFEGWTAFQLHDLSVAQDTGDVARLAHVDPSEFETFIAERRANATVPQLYKFAAHWLDTNA